MKAREIRVGEIFQIHPQLAGNPMFAGCLFVAKEAKSFGAHGYVQALGENGEPGGQAYYRPRFEELVETGGTVEWMAGRAPTEEEQ